MRRHVLREKEKKRRRRKEREEVVESRCVLNLRRVHLVEVFLMLILMQQRMNYSLVDRGWKITSK